MLTARQRFAKSADRVCAPLGKIPPEVFFSPILTVARQGARSVYGSRRLGPSCAQSLSQLHARSCTDLHADSLGCIRWQSGANSSRSCSVGKWAALTETRQNRVQRRVQRRAPPSQPFMLLHRDGTPV